jgi:hypothetical protein
MSSKTVAKYGKLIEHANRTMKGVRLGQMKVSPLAQRKFRQHWCNKILAAFDLDQLGTPELSFRDGCYFIVDGQHRIEALKVWNGPGWEDVAIDTFVWSGLTETEEAKLFRALNRRLNPDAFSDFKIAIVAGEPIQSEIEAIANSEKLVISTDNVKGSIHCPGTLMRVFQRDGAVAMRKALSVIRDAFGDTGFEAQVIDGMGLLCHRYNGVLDPQFAIESLRRINGGVKGLLNSANVLREKTGNPKNGCVAAAAVIAINRDRTGKNKLVSWFKE